MLDIHSTTSCEMRIKSKVLWLLLLYVLFALKIHNLLHSAEDDVIVASPDKNDVTMASPDRRRTLEITSAGQYIHETNRETEKLLRSRRTKPFTGSLCRRKEHVVYIKTHKTGSTTLVNLFWRFALKRRLHVLTFDVQIPFPNPSFIPFMLDSHPSLHKLSHFDIAADHMIYNKTDFRNVMPKDTVYISSLREPVSQFKSGVNFFVDGQDFNINDSDPISTLVRNFNTYLSGNNSNKLKKLRNRNAFMLGLRPDDFDDSVKVTQFVDNIATDFSHMLIAEYMDESLIVMRRKFCWEISDILYLPLRVRNYQTKDKPLEPEVMEKLTNWSKVDAMLYETFNETLWKNIAQYGQDFWDELEFYKKQKEKIFDFCSPFLKTKKEYCNISDLEQHMEIPGSPWGNPFKIDVVWCVMSKISTMILRNIIRVREYPEICDNIVPVTNYRFFMKSKTRPEVMIHPDHCSTNKTSEGSTFRVPVPVLKTRLCFGTKSKKINDKK